MRQRFTGAPDANVRQMNQMNRTIAHGSSYWYVNPSETSPTDLAFKFNENESVGGYVAGLIKTSPSRPTVAQRLHLQTPNCYVNDIIVDPALKRNAASPTNHYIGSMLMHAALNFGDFKPGASLAIDGYAGNDAANAWFDRLGLREDSTAELAGWAASDTITLPQVHYMSQPGQTLRRHVEALERVAPWLGNASLIVTT
jgi:ribosomal protein S18 acetylase RimI-like enzyme